MSVNKIRPNATIKYNYGTDGRDGYDYISYSCPVCTKNIKKKDIACTECGTFFDWTKTAKIKTVQTVEWE